ncbi:type I-F CRISPR-associated protein Csy2 [Halomonas elongata]|uniref:CRISPR-associated protein Csy2 n=1 Tax=Halomonas elongata (strain ATCC 33173 / DSM 2581 / NBRC 15536 / NCIMB 2198 / 1H9) TaxID=768066 RepID=E1V4U0_HALED|nr:type I-F CRISPR-associated protein Csy2 [Halomonas elongata]WBF18229.1 type I-F CRISPR-associated protein Csy2 [Halomonas elongata]WPU47080.1 type I-F CRISPR-associated protein Csy2 [Halomonas elongata DSM 2581]CBV40989.1 CRISPR-associated protein Csy2 [Halomonas elongata DSM 2581]
MSDVKNLLVLPRLRVQNANAISSPMTWGFPAMSAFVGMMHALERKLVEADIQVSLDRVGVVCHDTEAQATEGGYTRAFHLTRNPVDKAGNTAAIVEEGRIHLDITLIFAIAGKVVEGERQDIAHQISEMVAGMRVAGGSVMPNRSVAANYQKSAWVALDDEPSEREKQFKKLKRRWLPGFSLVLRDDRLAEHTRTLQAQDENATALDAWLDLSRLNHECHVDPESEEVRWQVRRPYRGWLVPMPVGYGAISKQFEPGSVENARDTQIPFRFVESIYSIGEWISPHRLTCPEDMLWYVDNDLDAGLYRLNNDYVQRAHRA